MIQVVSVQCVGSAALSNVVGGAFKQVLVGDSICDVLSTSQDNEYETA